MTTTTLQERYESVHNAILAGPNAQLQEWVDSGTAWLLEGHVGRTAMAALTDGALVLPSSAHRDYYGNTVPSYLNVQDEIGSPGSVANAEAYDEQD
jgi:hypothetical protein